LEGFTEFETPISLADLRSVEVRLRAIYLELKQLHKNNPLYFPFELSGKRQLRMLQGYSFKLPRTVLGLFFQTGQPVLSSTVEESLGRLWQGFGSAEVNRLVELHAMKAAKLHFEELGYTVDDVSARNPFDLVAARGSEILTIEVKGTTSAGERVILTKNEVSHARAHPGSCVLFVLESIKIRTTESGLSVGGGSPLLVKPWNPSEDSLEAISYYYRLPPIIKVL